MLQFDEEVIAWTCNGLQNIFQKISYTAKKKKNKKNKKKLKNSDIKISERPKKLKNQIIHCLEIIETIYIYMIKQ